MEQSKYIFSPQLKGELKMNYRKYLMPTLAVFIVITVFNMIFHGVVMEKTYLDNSFLFRPQDEIQKHKLCMWVANFIYSFAFCYIYSKGYEKKEDFIAQGIRYGLWITLLIWIPDTIINHAIFPFPKSLHIGWLIGYTAQSIIAGITAALVFSKSK